MSKNIEKSKLNQFWDELKTNLPEINFDDEKVSSTAEGDDCESTEAIASAKYLDLDSIDLLDDDLNDEVSSNSSAWNECEKNFERYLKKDEHTKFLYESDLSNGNGEETIEVSPRNENIKSNEQAASITKNIFETINPKLSMGIFESINLDDLLESVGGKVDANEIDKELSFFSYKPNQLPTASRFVNDENVLMKLAQMSKMISKDEELDLKTGAIISSNTGGNLTGRISKVTFDLVENELIKSDKKNRNELSEEIIKNDLNNFLKSHNIRDGNLVATRRIDLRPNQNLNGHTKESNKKSAHLLMQNILNTNDDEKYFRNIANKPIKFLNEDSDDESSSDSSDDSDETNSKTLWIERYRQQKMKNLNKIVK